MVKVQEIGDLRYNFRVFGGDSEGVPSEKAILRSVNFPVDEPYH
jgi:hypothetical protein